MENKYFTPDIEDICIGYECEINNTHGKWESITITFTNSNSFYKTDIAEVCLLVEDKYVKVPYLTKEQIEAEGWIEDKGLYKLRKNEDLFFTIDFNTDSYFLKFCSYSKVNTTYYSGDHIFKGFCKDINTFRKITKLLGI